MPCAELALPPTETGLVEPENPACPLPEPLALTVGAGSVGTVMLFCRGG